MHGTTVLRRFNRSYTQRIGALDDSFLGLGLPPGAARLLFEIGEGVRGVQELRALLDLDSGYLSRLLRSLEARGLAEVSPDPADRRRRQVSLTPTGLATLARLDERSEARADHLLQPLSERQRQRLVEALATADLLVRAATVVFETLDPSSPAARAAMGHYFAELDRRFEGGFDPGEQTAADVAPMGAPHGTFTLARSDGRAVACGGVQRIGTDEHGPVAEIKRMWVADDWRGAGLGARMLRRLEEDAAALGHGVVRLDTNATLTDAVALYGRSGYQAIERYNDNPYAHHWFEKPLTPPR